MTEPVSWRIEGAIGLIETDNPPVNAAGHAVRAGLVAALDALNAAPEVLAIGLYGAGRSFIAGADIREFGKPSQPPSLPDVCQHLEDSAKPVAAILHGVALGGGLEVAISAQARIALPGTKLGFPEVNLGIIPGAGGTQRAPRLIGMAAAAELITSGKPIATEAALKLGLIDRIAEGAPKDLARTAAQELIDGTLPSQRTASLTATPDPERIEQTRSELHRRHPHDLAKQKALYALSSAPLPFAEGLQAERAIFKECLASAQRAGLVHAFFAERSVAKIPEATAKPRKIGRIGVVGAGTMGSGIATACLIAGCPVTLVERDAAALERGIASIAANLDGAVKRGKLSKEKRAEIALLTSRSLEDLTGADLVIEAVFEDFAVKRDVLAQIDAACPGAILASNTSYLDLNALAAGTRDPGAVLGLHFFSPAHVMRLLEVVVGRATRADIVATGFALAKRLGKVAVRAGVCDGFIGNRLLRRYRMACDHLVLDGAHPAEIDAALEAFGMALGPFRTSDLAGLDIAWADRKRRAPERPPEERYSALADRLCEAGHVGRKAGRGFYDYRGAEPVPNPDLDALIADERAAHGITPRAFGPEQIVARALTALIAEGARVVDEGIALRPIDVDAVYLFGYGFPRWRGGPLHYADALGAKAVVERIARYAAEDAHFWQAPALLAELAADGGAFADLNDAMLRGAKA